MNITRRAALAGGIALSARPARAGQKIRLGLLRTLSPAPFYIAQDRGYFTASGTPVEFVFFDSAQPIAAAAVSGDIDVGVTALTGGFFSLAGRGALKVIGGALHEQKGFDLTAILVSNAAYAAGVTSVDKLRGRSFGITQYGSSFHYMIGRIAERAGFEAKDMTLRPLQQVGNMVAAVRSGQVDATMAIASMAKPMAASGEAHIIGWVGDMVPYQITALFTTQPMIANRADDLRAFCDAYRHGILDYRAAFLTKGAPEAVTEAAVVSVRHFIFASDSEGPSKIRNGVGWYDEGGALDVADVKAQLAWFTEQNMVKGAINVDDIVDTHFLPVR